MAALATVSGSTATWLGRAAAWRGEGHLADAAAPGPGRRGRGLGGGAQALLGQVGGVGEAGGLAHHDPDAGAPVAARGQLLDPAVVEQGRRGPLVLDEDLGEVAAGAEGSAERPLDDRFVEHGRPRFAWMAGESGAGLRGDPQ